MMNTLAVMLVVLAIAFVVIAAPSIANVANAVGVAHEKNFGQCKQEKNRQACESNKDKFTGP